jgi:regulator of cell morphogenesis and NO signaling
MDITTAFIHELVTERPRAVAILREHGIDHYRSGNLTLWQAATSSKVDLDALTSQLSETPSNPQGIPTSRRGLIDYIQTRYHRVHLNHLHTALRLSRSIESTFKDRPEVPRGLAAHLTTLIELAEEHQQKEQDTLFPSLLFSPQHNLSFPILRAIVEHDELCDELDSIARLTDNYTAPPDASKTWKRLYDLCREIDGEMRFHMHVENTALYGRYMRSGTKA